LKRHGLGWFDRKETRFIGNSFLVVNRRISFQKSLPQGESPCLIRGYRRADSLETTITTIQEYMGKRDSRIDDYIAKSADFAKPILNHIRELVHDACPDVEETLKWSFPHFTHKGMLCSMASFKNHCAFGFWKSALIFDSKRAKIAEDEAMGQFGRITSLSDLPKDKVLRGYLKKAVELNEAGIKEPARAKPKAKKELIVPDYLMSALKMNKKALAAFENFTYSHKKEYLEWITEAKTEDTRNRRMETAIKWMAEGKSRNWKYQHC
jgi:uncharacterized protein YdeI (YjbR/CyaY-like superfamily)